MWRWLLALLGRRPAALPSVDVSALAPVRHAYFDGEKFPGGFGPTQLLTADYWTLRARSAELFEANLYARGIIRRFVTNVINTGLHLEAIPEELILGLERNALADWSEEIETRFSLWEKSPWLCDFKGESSFGAIQAAAYAEALIAGDVLVVLRQDRKTGLPRVQLINGASVQTPLRRAQRGNRIVHGVELDASDRHVAYWLMQRNGTSRRIPAVGEKSGRRIAWLVYGTDRRLDQVRGFPILSLVVQSLKEIDRYRDATQRKAVINSILALFIKKSVDRIGSSPLSGGATRRDTIVQQDETSTRSFQVAEFHPGLVIEELQQGEEPQAFGAQGTDEKFGEFEEAIIQAVAWALETPPEILRLTFGSNYSASQAAINEYKMALNRLRMCWGEGFCAPIYREWLLSEALTQKITAPGLLEAWRDSVYDIYAAWIASDWSGQIKPAVDPSRLIRFYVEAIKEGLITRDRACRELTGMKYSRVVKQLAVENAQLQEALAALGHADANASNASSTDLEKALLELVQRIEMLEDEREAA